MGYLRDLYTKEYYLHHDHNGNPLDYGAAGLEEFQKGLVRAIDLDILERIDFNGKFVLDLGCGRGEAVKYAAEHGAVEVHGVDFSEAAISIAREFLNKANIRVPFHCVDALGFLRSWTVRTNSARFDIVLMLDCVEHIPRSELSEILEALLPLMTPRGLLAINTPVYAVDNDVLTEGLKPKARDSSDEFEATSGMHCNRYTRNSLKTYMRSHGFAPISYHLFLANLQPPWWLVFSRLLRWRAAKLGYPILLPQALKPELSPVGSWKLHPALAPARWLKRLLRKVVDAR